MSPDTPPDEFDALAGEQIDLADLLNTVLDKGVILHGDVTLAVADVDLIKLNLGLLLSALETVESHPSANRATLANTFGPPQFTSPPTQASPPEELAQGLGRGGGADGPLQSRRSVGPTLTAEALPADTVPDAQTPSLNAVAHGLPQRINTDVTGVESGLARLVLTLIEVLRKVLEHQAIRRMDGGKLSPAEVERLGLALSKLSDRMDDLKRVFGLSDDDLQIDLGPLGRLR